LDQLSTLKYETRQKTMNEIARLTESQQIVKDLLLKEQLTENDLASLRIQLGHLEPIMDSRHHEHHDEMQDPVEPPLGS
jgi:hypothetical protein